VFAFDGKDYTPIANPPPPQGAPETARAYERVDAHTYRSTMNEDELLQRITVDPAIFGGKPIVRGRRLAVEHVLGMLAAGDSPETLLQGYQWLELDDIRACLAYAHRLVAHERVEPRVADASA
jgi:uncharacterized protein (DUF433 family)